MHIKNTVTALVMLYAALSVLVVNAADNVDAIKQLQDQKALSDAQKDLIKSQADALAAQKDLINAQFPKFSGGKSGEIAFSGSSVDSFHANLFAYDALSSLACKLAKNAAFADAKRVLLMSNEDLVSVVATRQVQYQIDQLVKDYKSLLPEDIKFEVAITQLPYAVGTALSSIADLGRLFRTDQKISQENISLSDTDLANALIGCDPKKFVLPSSLSLSSYFLDAPNASALWNAYKEAGDYRSQVISKLKRARVELATMDASKLADKAGDRAKYIQLKTRADRIDSLLERHTSLDGIVLGVNETTKEPILVRLLRGEAIKNVVANKNEKAVLLTASVVLKGGFSVVSQSIWREDKFYSRGGLVISYRAQNPDGSVIASGFMSEESSPARVHFH